MNLTPYVLDVELIDDGADVCIDCRMGSRQNPRCLGDVGVDRQVKL